MEQQIPLNYEASAGDTNKQATTTLPREVVQCLENARFVRAPEDGAVVELPPAEDERERRIQRERRRERERERERTTS